MAWEPGATIKVIVAVPVLYPFAGFLPTTCALPIVNLPSKKVTAPPVAAFLLVVTVAVRIIFCFTFAGLGATERVMALTEVGVHETGDCSAASVEQNRDRPAIGSRNNFSRRRNTLSFISDLVEGNVNCPKIERPFRDCEPCNSLLDMPRGQIVSLERRRGLCPH